LSPVIITIFSVFILEITGILKFILRISRI